MSEESPYKTIAVASTFSPRFEAVLAEAKRVRDRFQCQLNVIYVGDKTAETTSKFRDAFAGLSLPDDSIVHYEQGDPAESILRALRANKIELIIAGALEKELILHPFLGNVARRLLREAPCSVMLFTHPATEPKSFRNLVFVADYSEHAREALRRTFQLAVAEKSECLHVVRVITPFDKARAARDGGDECLESEDEEADLEKFVLSAGHTDAPIEARCIRGNTGFAAADFVRAIGADLLVVPVTPSSDGSLPGNIAWLTDVIPCNLWLIR